MSSSQSRGCLGKRGWGLTPPGRRKAGQRVTRSAARQWVGASHARGAQPFPLSCTRLVEDRLILQKRQHRAADLHQPGQASAGRKASERPSWVPAGLAGLRVFPGRPLIAPYPLGRKLPCQMVEVPALACTARSITNTSASVEPTACCWMPRVRCRGTARGHPCPGVTPSPGAVFTSPHAASHTLLTPTSCPDLTPPT